MRVMDSKTAPRTPPGADGKPVKRAKTSIEIDGKPISPKILARFEEASEHIRIEYGKSPTSVELLLMWLESCDALDIKTQFARAVGFPVSKIRPNGKGKVTEQSFNF